MARLQRQELKHDEFVDRVDETLLYLEQHGRTLLTLALALVVGGGALGGFYWYSRQQDREANAALGAALETFDAPVQAGLPTLAGAGAPKTFGSEREKFDAAEKEFAAVRATFPRTRAGLVARYYQAVCQFQKGETPAALAALGELSRASDRNLAAVAQFTLAGYYESLGREAEAEKLYRELAERPAATVPRATVLLALANLKARSNPAEARLLLNQVRAEYPDTPVAAEVSRRLELLPAPAPPAPPAQP